MVNINQVYQSKYISAADLMNKAHELVISNVTTERLDDGKDKLCVYFQGKQKGLLLNKTNATNIATLYGPETTNWHGQPITLFPAWVDFQGKTTEAVRVRGPGGVQRAPINTQDMSRHPNAPPPEHTGQFDRALDDEIPF